eukprot:gb/GEZJ01002164.1/.p2 GENE.gb/GEZJ01002164.1/~~gb/GEZJ01002164.1/.p2  ORF type:complete len:184 (+),score=20.11 gb/GEZJ01002164.1/:269-820(+)
MLYWPEALKHAVSCKNAITLSSTNDVPFKELFKSDPNYVKHLRPFGCKALGMVGNPKARRKLEPRLHSGVNLGHLRGGLYQFLLNNLRFKTEHVTFNESTFSGLPSQTSTGSLPTPNAGTDGYDSNDEVSLHETPDLGDAGDYHDELFDPLEHIPGKPSDVDGKQYPDDYQEPKTCSAARLLP